MTTALILTHTAAFLAGVVLTWLYARPALHRAERLLAKVGDLLPPRG